MPGQFRESHAVIAPGRSRGSFSPRHPVPRPSGRTRSGRGAGARCGRTVLWRRARCVSVEPMHPGYDSLAAQYEDAFPEPFRTPLERHAVAAFAGPENRDLYADWLRLAFCKRTDVLRGAMAGLGAAV